MAEADKVIGGFWTITRSQVYRELADLAERGLVELSEHRKVHSHRLAEYQKLDRDLANGGVPADQRVTLAYGIAYESAVLDWFDQLPEPFGERSSYSPAERRTPSEVTEGERDL